MEKYGKRYVGVTWENFSKFFCMEKVWSRVRISG
jgi:hypothetical protein